MRMSIQVRCKYRKGLNRMKSEIAVVDISPFLSGDAAAKQELAGIVDRACSEIGFLIVSGHGVAQDLVARMRAVSLAFFEQADALKQRNRMPPDRYRGYISLGSEALANSMDDATPPDLKESFSIGPTDAPDDAYRRASAPADFFAANQWPDAIPGFRETWTEYYGEMERVATVLMRIFACALGMDEHYFDDKVDRHISNFSVIHYPEQATPPLPGQLRAGAHTDYGSLTIVRPDDAPGGLQVLTHDGAWMDVPYVEGAFVINLGDLMADWTNDRWVSTLHRVVNPPLAAGASGRRLSMTFFHQPNYDAMIECLPTCTSTERPPRHSTTTSGEHVWMKITKHRQPQQAGG